MMNAPTPSLATEQDSADGRCEKSGRNETARKKEKKKEKQRK